MRKQIFCVLMAMVLICNLGFYAIAEEKNVVVLHNCDTVFGNFKMAQDAARGKCVTYDFDGTAASFASGVKFSPINAMGTDTLAMEIYVSDPTMFSHMSQLYVEITSSGTCDHRENAWAAHTQLSAGKINKGWNTVYFYLEESGTTDGACDLSAINYLRIYAFFDGAALKGETIKFDNIRMIYTGGYDYSDLSLEAYRGDNPDTDIRIEGQSEPDLSRRHDNITVAVGR